MLDHYKMKPDDAYNNNISGTSLIGGCVAIRRDWCRNSSRFTIYLIDDVIRWDIRSSIASRPHETSHRIINQAVGKHSARSAV